MSSSSSSAAAAMRNGQSLLHEALSPSSKQLMADFLSGTGDNNAELAQRNDLDFDDDDDDDDGDDLDPTLRASTAAFYERQSLAAVSSRAKQGDAGSRTDFALRKMVSTVPQAPSATNGTGAPIAHNRNFVQIECAQRPFCLQLSANARGDIVVAGFTADPTSRDARGAVERSGRVHVGDVLVAVNDEMDALSGSVDAAAKVMLAAKLPALLTFRRVPVVKTTLGEYSRDQIAQNLELYDTKLSQFHGVQDAASMIKACIDIQDDHKSMTPLMHYVQRIEQFLYPTAQQYQGDAQRRLEELRIWMDRVHQYGEKQAKDQFKKWSANKASNYKRIEMVSKQRDSIMKRLATMRATPELLHPGNHVLWQDFIELRHLASQLTRTVEHGKRDHYLPDFEGYALRFGSDGVYVGLGDLWLSSFHARFSVETHARAPHVMFHLSSPSTTGLKLRCTNVKLATEGRLPNFQCDELNIEAHLVATVPFVYDEVSGWSVPQDDLHVKLQSFSYYERRANSTKRGADHDTVIKLFINRLLPSVVRHAAQNLFCVELGPLLESRNANVMFSGEIKVDGRPLELYDAPLNTFRTGASSSDAELSEEARRLMVLTEDEADALCRIFKSVETGFKKRGFVTSEHSNLSLRVITYYFDQFKQTPHLHVLLALLWNQSLQLLLTGSLTSSEPTESFASTMIANLEQLQQYPVDVSLTFSEVTVRLDLCEGAATYHTIMQRILRHRMSSVSVGMSDIDALQDSSYYEKKLTDLDDLYDKVTRVLSYVTTNVDELGVVMRGGIPAGFRSNMLLQAYDLACKGPCTGSFTIPLTDLANIHVPKGSQQSDSFTALLHERNALVFSKFFLGLGDSDQEEIHGGDALLDDAGRVKQLPQDRVSVSVKNTSAKVLFEVPSDLSTLTPGATFTPFSFNLAAENGDPPTLRFETGEFAKCQYKAEQIKIGGSVWRLLKRSAAKAEAAVDAGAGAATSRSSKAKEATSDNTSTASQDDSIWMEYLDSQFFFLKFHFLTSCQVTRDHIFWSLKSASLTHPNVARVRHRISIVELLQDIGMASLVDNRGKDTQRIAKRRQEAQFRRALYQKLGNNQRPEDDDQQTIGHASLNLSAVSGPATPSLSRHSFVDAPEDDGFEPLSEEEFDHERSQLSDGDNNEVDDNELQDNSGDLVSELTASVSVSESPHHSVEKQSSVFF